MHGILKFFSANFLAFVVVCVFLPSCGFKQEKGGPQRFEIPWPQSDGTYHLSEVSVDTLDDYSTMQGKAASLRVAPTISDGTLQGELPSAKFLKTKDGLLIPLDFLTSQMAVIYAHVERLKRMDEQLGIADQIRYPRFIGVGVNVSVQGVSSKVTNNALYYQPSDAVLFVPFDQSRLPISFNAGAIAHEYFHGIFQALVGKHLGKFADNQVSERPDPVIDNNGPNYFDKKNASAQDRYHRVLLRSLNEGLADFWGWIYSGDDHFVARSLPELTMARRLDREVVPLVSTRQFQGDVARMESMEEAVAYSYSRGIEYALLLRSAAFAMFSDGGETGDGHASTPVETSAIRARAADWFIKSLPRLRSAFQNAIEENQPVSTSQVVDAIFFGEKPYEVNKRLCKTLRRVITNSREMAETCGF